MLIFCLLFVKFDKYRAHVDQIWPHFGFQIRAILFNVEKYTILRKNMIFEVFGPPRGGPLDLQNRPKSHKMRRRKTTRFQNRFVHGFPRFRPSYLIKISTFFGTKSTMLEKGPTCVSTAQAQSDWGSGLPKSIQNRHRIDPNSHSETDYPKSNKKTCFWTTFASQNHPEIMRNRFRKRGDETTRKTGRRNSPEIAVLGPSRSAKVSTRVSNY